MTTVVLSTRIGTATVSATTSAIYTTPAALGPKSKKKCLAKTPLDGTPVPNYLGVDLPVGTPVATPLPDMLAPIATPINSLDETMPSYKAPLSPGTEPVYDSHLSLSKPMASSKMPLPIETPSPRGQYAAPSPVASGVKPIQTATLTSNNLAPTMTARPPAYIIPQVSSSSAKAHISATTTPCASSTSAADHLAPKSTTTAAAPIYVRPASSSKASMVASSTAAASLAPRSTTTAAAPLYIRPSASASVRPASSSSARVPIVVSTTGAVYKSPSPIPRY